MTGPPLLGHADLRCAVLDTLTTRALPSGEVLAEAMSVGRSN